MKTYLSALAAIVLFASCEMGGWESEYKDMYHKACMDEATWVLNDADKQKYCDCVLEKTMAQYPTVADALENIDKIGSDSTIQSCKAGIATK